MAPAGRSTSDLLKGATAQLGSLSDALSDEVLGKLILDSAPWHVVLKLTKSWSHVWVLNICKKKENWIILTEWIKILQYVKMHL